MKKQPSIIALKSFFLLLMWVFEFHLEHIPRLLIYGRINDIGAGFKVSVTSQNLFSVVRVKCNRPPWESFYTVSFLLLSCWKRDMSEV